MIELALLAIFSRLMTWGFGPVIATRTVAADCDAVRAFLSDAANQARLTTSRANVVAMKSGVERCDVLFCLPLGAGLRASVQVKAPTPRVLKTEVRLHRKTVAWATWILSGGRATTQVDVAFQLQSRSLVARLVVLLGGRWIAGRLEIALATLATRAAHAAEDLRALPAAAVVPPSSARCKTASVSQANRVAVHR